MPMPPAMNRWWSARTSGNPWRGLLTMICWPARSACTSAEPPRPSAAWRKAMRYTSRSAGSPHSEYGGYGRRQGHVDVGAGLPKGWLPAVRSGEFDQYHVVGGRLQLLDDHTPGSRQLAACERLGGDPCRGRSGDAVVRAASHQQPVEDQEGDRRGDNEPRPAHSARICPGGEGVHGGEQEEGEGTGVDAAPPPVRNTPLEPGRHRDGGQEVEGEHAPGHRRGAGSRR